MKKKRYNLPLSLKIVIGVTLVFIFSLTFLYLIPIRKTVSQTVPQKVAATAFLLSEFKKTSPLPFSDPQPTAFEYRFDPNSPVAINGYKIKATGTGKEFKPFGQDVLTLQNAFVAMGYTVSTDNQADGPGSSQTGVQKDNTVCIIYTDTPNMFKDPGCPNTTDYNDPGTCEALVEISCGEVDPVKLTK